MALNVLVVDDSVTMVLSLKTTLTMGGCQPTYGAKER